MTNLSQQEHSEKMRRTLSDRQHHHDNTNTSNRKSSCIIVSSCCISKLVSSVSLGKCSLFVGILTILVVSATNFGMMANIDWIAAMSGTTKTTTSKITIPYLIEYGRSAATNNTGVDWWDVYVDPIARPFSNWKGKDKYGWCILQPIDDDRNDKSKNNHNNRMYSTKTIPKKDNDDLTNNADKLEEPSISGLLFVKNHKSASSTGAGITKRIAFNLGARKFQKQKLQTLQKMEQESPLLGSSDVCAHQASHSFADNGGHVTNINTNIKNLDGRNKQTKKDLTSLLWTIIRHPKPRALSGFFYFRAAGEREPPTDENIIRFCHSQKSSQVNYLLGTSSSSSSLSSTKNQQDKEEAIARMVLKIKEQIFDSFQFVAVMERMEESLVVFKLLFELDDSDIIVLPSKQSGSYVPGPNGKCTQIPTVLPSKSARRKRSKNNKGNLHDSFSSGRFDIGNDNSKKNNNENKNTTTITTATTTMITISETIEDYLSSKDFLENNYDFLLYHVANRSLDLTIHALGRQLVEKEVQKYKLLQQMAIDKCQSEAYFPCSANGTKQMKRSKDSCYENDWGCGYHCIDRIMKKTSRRL